MNDHPAPFITVKRGSGKLPHMTTAQLALLKAELAATMKRPL
jgi:hypothetical protein